ncbi:MAG: glycosyltransferase family 10 [Desulfopila sp.]|jgi:hypothetical protein|nr:glycosyltransferase family 10 [Desulfopila sp.]
MSKRKIVVKFMHRGFPRGRSAVTFLRQFPNLAPQWDNCHFTFDVDCREYDWLVVYHDLPSDGSRFATVEQLACPRERTMLLTGEPSTITVFGVDYLKQFGSIVTFQEPWAMRRHPQVFFRPPGLLWHYGLASWDGDCTSWDAMAAAPPSEKTEAISTVCSSRSGKTTLHSERVSFTWWLKERMDELAIFGHGVNPMRDKAEALDPFKYHIAVENHVYNHHITEKLPDAFLGRTLPFYHGAPNATEYFPKESFIPIDIRKPVRTAESIRYHMANNEYEDRLPYIEEARRRVLEEHNLFAVIADSIKAAEKAITTSTHGGKIYNRSTIRIKKPAAGLRSIFEKVAVKTYHRYIRKTREAFELQRMKEEMAG